MATAAQTVLQIFDVVGTIFLWTWWIFLVGGLWWMKKKYSKHPIDTVIIEKRGENLVKTNDRMGTPSLPTASSHYPITHHPIPFAAVVQTGPPAPIAICAPAMSEVPKVPTQLTH